MAADGDEPGFVAQAVIDGSDQPQEAARLYIAGLAEKGGGRIEHTAGDRDKLERKIEEAVQ